MEPSLSTDMRAESLVMCHAWQAACMHLMHAAPAGHCVVGLSPSAAFWRGGLYRGGVISSQKLPGGAPTRVSPVRPDKLRTPSLCRCNGGRLRHSRAGVDPRHAGAAVTAPHAPALGGVSTEVRPALAQGVGVCGLPSHEVSRAGGGDVVSPLLPAQPVR